MWISVVIPTYNRLPILEKCLRALESQRLSDALEGFEVVVVDDGSTDETPMLLARQPVEVIRHASNRGYGHSLLDAFRWAKVDDYDWVVTMDCDEQHEPAAIPRFLEAAARGEADVISGSRYLEFTCEGDCPPKDRRAINAEITGEINERLGLSLTFFPRGGPGLLHAWEGHHQ